MQKFNGFKTIIGLILIGAAAAGKAALPDIPIWDSIEEAGKIITQVGLIHKAIKSN